MGGNPNVCNFCRNVFLVGRVETSRVGVIFRMRSGGRPSALILAVLIQWSHDFIDSSDLYPHVLFLTQPESKSKRYRILCKLVVTLICLF